jgi:hypothetical protein
MDPNSEVAMDTKAAVLAGVTGRNFVTGTIDMIGNGFSAILYAAEVGAAAQRSLPSTLKK